MIWDWMHAEFVFGVPMVVLDEACVSEGRACFRRVG
jgi:hypothetical protein